MRPSTGSQTYEGCMMGAGRKSSFPQSMSMIFARTLLIKTSEWAQRVGQADGLIRKAT